MQSSHEATMASGDIIIVLQIISFINNYRELQSMGFPSEVAVGALIVNDNNLEKATDACISVR